MERYYRKTHQFEMLKTEILCNFELVHVTVVNLWVLWFPCLILELNLPEFNTNFDFALLVLYLKFRTFSKTVTIQCVYMLWWHNRSTAVSPIPGCGCSPSCTNREIDDNINRNQVGYFTLMTEHCAEESFPCSSYNSSGSIQIVHPSCHRFSKRRQHFKKKEQPLLVWLIFRIFHNSVLAVEVTFYKISYEMIKPRRMT